MTRHEEVRDQNGVVRAYCLNQDSYSNDRTVDPAFLRVVKNLFPDVVIRWNNRVQRWAVCQNLPVVEYYWLEQLGGYIGMEHIIPRRLFFWKDESGGYLPAEDTRLIKQLALSDTRRTSRKELNRFLEGQYDG